MQHQPAQQRHLESEEEAEPIDKLHYKDSLQLPLRLTAWANATAPRELTLLSVAPIGGGRRRGGVAGGETILIWAHNPSDEPVQIRIQATKDQTPALVHLSSLVELAPSETGQIASFLWPSSTQPEDDFSYLTVRVGARWARQPDSPVFHAVYHLPN